jgi:hypothetical protein
VEVNELHNEGEFNVSASQKLNLGDLLKPLEKHQDQAKEQPIVSSGKVKKDINRIVRHSVKFLI